MQSASGIKPRVLDIPVEQNNEPRIMKPLIHQYSIQTARNLFWSAKHGCLISRRAIAARDAAYLGLEPMIIYGLVVGNAGKGDNARSKARQYALT